MKRRYPKPRLYIHTWGSFWNPTGYEARFSLPSPTKLLAEGFVWMPNVCGKHIHPTKREAYRCGRQGWRRWFHSHPEMIEVARG